MARNVSTRRSTSPEFGPRELLLAGLGAVSLTRRYALELGEDAAAQAGALRKRADASIKAAVVRIERGRDQAVRSLQPLADSLASRASQLRARLPASLQSLAGAKPARAAKGRTRKPAKRRSTARRQR